MRQKVHIAFMYTVIGSKGGLEGPCLLLFSVKTWRSAFSIPIPLRSSGLTVLFPKGGDTCRVTWLRILGNSTGAHSLRLTPSERELPCPVSHSFQSGPHTMHNEFHSLANFMVILVQPGLSQYHGNTIAFSTPVKTALDLYENGFYPMLTPLQTPLFHRY